MPNADPIAESLVRRRITRVCHMTSCHHLPSIFAGGGLLSWNERRARGVEEPENSHYWGAVGKKEAFADYVVCSFMPPWWMCERRTEELAIILLDSRAVCSRPGVLFCPINSARSDYSAEEILTRQGIDSLDECFVNPTTYQAFHSEILVPEAVPLVDFREVIFCDDDALEYWRGEIREAFRLADPRPALPNPGIKPRVGRALGLGFPGGWVPTTRIRT